MDTVHTRPRLDDQHLAVLTLLVTGRTIRTIARRLHLSARTVGSLSATVMAALAAPTRFVGGIHAIRHRHVAQRYVLEQASHQRAHREWLEPTPRQHEMLLLLASGSTNKETATTLGLGVRTVQRDLSALATGNGVRGAFATGALAEALGWIDLDRPPQPR